MTTRPMPTVEEERQVWLALLIVSILVPPVGVIGVLWFLCYRYPLFGWSCIIGLIVFCWWLVS